MPPTPPSGSSTSKKASNPTTLRSRPSKAGSITRGSASAATSSLGPKTSNNAHTRSGSGGIRKPTTAAGSILKTGLMGAPAGKRPVNEKFDNLFFKSPVPRAITKLLSNSQSTSSANNNPAVPSSLRRSIGAGPSASVSTTTTPSAGARKTRSLMTKKPTTTAPASTGQSPKQPTKPTSASTRANGDALVNFTLPNDSQEQVLPTPMDESSDGGSEDVIPARAAIKPKPQARTNLRSSVVVPGTSKKLPVTRTTSARGTNGKYNKRAKQTRKESTKKKVVESPKGLMRNTASSRARAAANAGAGAKSGAKAGEVQAERTSTASVGTAAVAMATPTTPTAPPRETRSSGLSSQFKNQARGHINAWAEAQRKGSPEPAKGKESRKEGIMPPTPEVHILTFTRSSATTGNQHEPPSVSPPKPKSTRKPQSSTLTPGFAIPPGILDKTGSLWDSGRRKSRRSIGTPSTTTTPITYTRRRTTIASGSVMSTDAAGADTSRNRKRKSMSDADAESVGKKARISDPEAMETPDGGAGGSGDASGDASKPAPAKRGKGGKGKEKKVYVNTDFEFSDIEV